MLKKIAIWVLFGLLSLVVVVNSLITLALLVRQQQHRADFDAVVSRLVEDREAVTANLDTIREDLIAFDTFVAQWKRDREVLLQDRETIRGDRIKTLEMVDEEITGFKASTTDEVLVLFDKQTARVRDHLTELQTQLVTDMNALDESVSTAYANDVVLERAICESDYWVNSTRTMVWRTLDYLAGGETTVEEAKAFWDGILVDQEKYGATISPICAVGPDGAWVLEPNILRLTEDVTSR